MKSHPIEQQLESGPDLIHDGGRKLANSVGQFGLVNCQQVGDVE